MVNCVFYTHAAAKSNKNFSQQSLFGFGRFQFCSSFDVNWIGILFSGRHNFNVCRIDRKHKCYFKFCLLLLYFPQKLNIHTMLNMFVLAKYTWNEFFQFYAWDKLHAIRHSITDAGSFIIHWRRHWNTKKKMHALTHPFVRVCVCWSWSCERISVLPNWI